MRTESCILSVVVGAILAVAFCGTPALHAAEKKPSRASARQGEGTFGIVTAKTNKDITIKAEGEDEAKRISWPPRAIRRGPTFRPR